ncbi:MAG: pirin family protein [Gammaproteobacteria bacterium]|nr:pirin family protein [Gammaproteobacteria bacterium]
MTTRTITRVVTAQPATDGAGVKINRNAGFDGELRMDPFLMLDEIRSESKDDFIAGFPAHPHRGFETVTYMREGRFSHRDSMGNSGAISGGGAQWMTAGSGVIHSEMPAAGADRMHGFQFWLNLPASEKMMPPAYRDIQAEEIGELHHQDARIRLIAGDLTLGETAHTGVVSGKTTRALIADVTLPTGNAGIGYAPELSSQFYLYRGTVNVAQTTVRAGQLAYLSHGEQLELSEADNAGLLLFGGLPLAEPVVHYGPFVMNTREQIEQALQDYRDGVLVQS